MKLLLDILLFGMHKNPSRVITPFQAGKNSSKNLISLMNSIDSLLMSFRKNYTVLELMSSCLAIPFTK